MNAEWISRHVCVQEKKGKLRLSSSENVGRGEAGHWHGDWNLLLDAETIDGLIEYVERRKFLKRHLK